MAELAQNMGVEIRLSEAVTGFDFQGKRPVAVNTDEHKYDCDAVVINADFAQAMKKLVPNSIRRRWTDE